MCSPTNHSDKKSFFEFFFFNRKNVKNSISSCQINPKTSWLFSMKFQFFSHINLIGKTNRKNADFTKCNYQQYRKLLHLYLIIIIIVCHLYFLFVCFLIDISSSNNKIVYQFLIHTTDIFGNFHTTIINPITYKSSSS